MMHESNIGEQDEGSIKHPRHERRFEPRSPLERALVQANSLGAAFGLSEDQKESLSAYTGYAIAYLNNQSDKPFGEAEVGERYSILEKVGVSPVLIEAAKMLAIKAILDEIREENARGK